MECIALTEHGNHGYPMRVIARAHNAYTDKFAVPRQPGLVPEVLTRITFEPDYRNPDALRGIEGFSHLWLVWVFDRSLREEWSPTVRPPRLGGNKRVGVFATRSPFRPNPIGLSCVRLVKVENCELLVEGADLADDTPILDIKPYLPYSDSVPEAKIGFVTNLADPRLDVECSQVLLNKLSEEQREALLSVLSRDPRPAYQDDPERVYGFLFAGFNVRFTVSENVLKVISIEEENA